MSSLSKLLFASLFIDSYTRGSVFHTILIQGKLIGEKRYYYNLKENQKSEGDLIIEDFLFLGIEKDLKLLINNIIHII
jgi:hypothetical protein